MNRVIVSVSADMVDISRKSFYQSLPPAQPIQTQLPAMKRQARTYRFVTEKFLRENRIQITKYQSAQLRRDLAQGIYWMQITPGGLIHWNEALLMDYLQNGDSPSHRSLLEEYISTLPVAV